MSGKSVFILQPDLGPDKLSSYVNEVEKCSIANMLHDKTC